MAGTYSENEMAREPVINILVATFVGLGLPRTLSLPTKSTATIGDLYFSVLDRLPPLGDSLILTTVSNRQLLPSGHEPISTLLGNPDDRLLSLRLSRRLCGGKGGFGSQLRAAGGRMSSRKSRDRQNQNVNGSNRNLDGRRLRTVDEAKRLAEYLAVKPDMERREKEERRKRWEAVVDAAEKRTEEIKSGQIGANRGRLDAEYVEGKELAEEKTREAVLKAMRAENFPERSGSESSVDMNPGSDDEAERSCSSSSGTAQSGANMGRSLFGWDEEDEDESEEDEDEHDEKDAGNTDQSQFIPETAPSYLGKGKAKAV